MSKKIWCERCRGAGKSLSKNGKFPVWYCPKCETVWRIDGKGHINTLKTFIQQK